MAASPRPAEVSTAVGFIPAALALALIVLAYAIAFFNPLPRKDAVMKRIMFVLAAFFLSCADACLSCASALAHGPTPQRAEEKVAVSAPPAAVWAVIKDFHSLAAWHPMVALSDGAGGDAPGAERQVTFKDGGALSEGLDDYDSGRE